MVVCVGDTETDVPVTAPTPLSMEKVGAGLPEADQDKTADCPEVMLAGFAEKEEMTGAEGVAAPSLNAANAARIS